MIARIVPVTRIRRDTSFWSYQIPAGRQVVPGSLVVVPFAGRDVLGVVWEVEKRDDKASKPITRIVTSVPLIKAPQRRFIEYLSQAGLCSLSTALYVWMPRALRTWPLRQATLELATNYLPPVDEFLPQRCILVPGHRPDQTIRLGKKFANDFAQLFSDQSEQDELIDWFRILRGEIRIGLGRERALFAPWANLRYLTVIEPEDVFYYHEQVPYLSFAEAAIELAAITKAEPELRSYLPLRAAERIWPGAQGITTSEANIRFVDLRREPIINDTLVAAIQDTLLLNQRILLLYNAHDRLQVKTKDGLDASVLIPGIESIARQLAKALGRETLLPDILLGTRSIFDQNYPNIGLVAALSLDPLLDTETIANQLHGLADLGHLFSYTCPTIIQAYRQEHPLMDALRGNRLGDFASELTREQQELGLPPFGQHIVLSLPEKLDRALVDEVYEKLASLLQAPWQISHPLSANWHKKPYWNLIMQTAVPETRLPAAVRKLAIALPAPWRLLRNPWYLM